VVVGEKWFEREAVVILGDVMDVGCCIVKCGDLWLRYLSGFGYNMLKIG